METSGDFRPGATEEALADRAASAMQSLTLDLKDENQEGAEDGSRRVYRRSAGWRTVACSALSKYRVYFDRLLDRSGNLL
jgi:hypothetical protein